MSPSGRTPNDRRLKFGSAPLVEDVCDPLTSPETWAHIMSPYRRVAARLHDQILSGALQPGQQLPTVKELAVANRVAVGTAQRALALLVQERLVSLNRSIRTTVRAPKA
jgi:DNA-binding GntR family transcriptional regulator